MREKRKRVDLGCLLGAAHLSFFVVLEKHRAVRPAALKKKKRVKRVSA